MTCRACPSFDPSRLPDYGYCKRAASPERLAQFFHAASTCWLGQPKPPARPVPLRVGFAQATA